MAQKKSTSHSLRKFLVPHMYSLPVDIINRAELLLPYKSYVKTQWNKRFLKKLNVKINEKYPVGNKDLAIDSNEFDDDLDHIRTVTEYGEEFFKIVNGRPLHHSIPLYKSLTNILDRRFRTIQEIGYKKDNALNIDTNFRLEKEIYDLTLHRVYEEAKTFDTYIIEDYKKSMRILNEEEKLNSKLDAKLAELQGLADESFTIMSRLLGLDYKYGLQQKYGRFLYYLSPPTWRLNNREFARSVEIEAKGFDFGHSHSEDTFTTMFENMRKECFTSFTKPVLYFTHPRDLVDVFSGMETQLLYHFSREVQLVPHIKSTTDAIRMLKQKMNHDSAVVTASIKEFRNLLSLCEEKCIQLEDQFFKILHGCFYEAVGKADVLKFNFHLEFCYSKVYYEKPMNLDMVTIAKALESFYMDYSKRLDSIQCSTVRRAMTKAVVLNDKKIEKAKKAAKELRLFNRLERELLKAHNLLPQENQLINASSKCVPKKKLKCDNPKSQVIKRNRYQSLNDAELDYLALFTDWTKNEDPAMYLQSLNIDKPSKEVRDL